MVQAFKKVLELSNSQAAWVQMAFYGVIFVWPYLQRCLLGNTHTGVLIGLALYASGALLFILLLSQSSFGFSVSDYIY